jgi:hypothetical protein
MAVKFGNGIDLANQRLINLADPSSPTDAVNKQYADALVRGLSWKQAVRAASTTSGNLLTAYAAGQTLDGVVLQVGDRILLKDQGDASENGIYVVTADVPTRAPDADDANELHGATVTVQEGTVNADRVYRLLTDNVVLGTTPLVWTEVGGAGNIYVAGNGLTESPAGQFNVGAGNGISVTADAVSLASSVAGNGLTYNSGVLNVGAGNGIVVEVDAVAIDPNVVSQTKAVTIGNGSANSFQVNHNLGKRDVVVQVASTSPPYSVIFTDVELTDPNYVTVTFASPPPSNSYRVTVVG